MSKSKELILREILHRYECLSVHTLFSHFSAIKLQSKSSFLKSKALSNTEALSFLTPSHFLYKLRFK